MSDRIKMFLKILRIELEDLEDDIKNLESLYEKKFQDKEITNYVFRENKALLEQEIRCVQDFCREMNSFTYEKDEPLDQILDAFYVFTRNIVNAKQYPEMVEHIVRYKVQKVLRYLDSI